MLRRPSILRRWASFAYADVSAIDEELIAILSAPAYDEGAGNTFSALFKAIRQPHFAPCTAEVLPALEMPILLVWGRQDRMVPFGLAQALVDLNPNLEFIELDPAGHCPHDECPDRFNALLLDWLDRRIEV